MHSERIQVLVTPEQRARLERISARENRSMGAIIREAIDLYTLPRARSRRDALQAILAMHAPVAEWQQMKAEIEQGALGE